MKACLFVFSLISVSVAAQQSAVEELEGLLGGLNKYEAAFSQAVVEEDGYVLDEQSGIMSFERPNRFYWNIEEPYPSLLVSDGQFVYLHDIDLNQVRVRNWSSNPAENPVAVLAGDLSIGEFYSVAKEENSFLLSPLSSNSGYESISIAFEEGTPDRMEIKDSIGQTTSIQFSSIESQDFPEAPYEFLMPVDAEIIHDD